MKRRWLRAVGISLVAALLVVAVLVARVWEPDRPVEALVGRWATPPSTFVEVLGMRVHVRDEGPRDDATPIVLLHGTSASLHTWEGWARALRDTRRVVRFDMQGFGLTGPSPEGAYDQPSYVRFVGAVLDKLGVQRAIVGGNSFGGAVAWHFAAEHPERVAALVLVDSGGYPMEARSMPIGFKLARTPILNRLVGSLLPRGVVESSVRNVYGDPSKVTPELIDLYFDLAVRAGNRKALVQRFAQAPSGPDAARIATLKCPTLILWGGRDRLIIPAHAERFHRDIAGSQLVMFDDLGHVPHEEDPAHTVAAVRSFLQSLPPKP